MLKIFADATVIFLVMYALFNISAKLIEFSKTFSSLHKFYAVAFPYDTDDLEYFLRRLSSSCEKKGVELIVLCDRLGENGNFIVKSLADEFSCIILLSSDEYKEKYL